MKMIYVIPLLLALSGCTTDTPEPLIVLPPAYGRGDSVRVQNKDMVGIVISVYRSGPDWGYDIMFKDQNISYEEKDLGLVEHFQWFKHSEKEAEVELGFPSAEKP